ncbi:hypothetical protein D9M72_629100 [compost metagenome]
MQVAVARVFGEREQFAPGLVRGFTACCSGGIRARTTGPEAQRRLQRFTLPVEFGHAVQQRGLAAGDGVQRVEVAGGHGLRLLVQHDKEVPDAARFRAQVRQQGAHAWPFGASSSHTLASRPSAMRSGRIS